MKVVEDVYQTSFDNLVDGTETKQARGAIKAINLIFSRVSRDIDFGAACRKKMWDKLHKPKESFVRPLTILH